MRVIRNYYFYSYCATLRPSRARFRRKPHSQSKFLLVDAASAAENGSANFPCANIPLRGKFRRLWATIHTETVLYLVPSSLSLHARVCKTIERPGSLPVSPFPTLLLADFHLYFARFTPRASFEISSRFAESTKEIGWATPYERKRISIAESASNDCKSRQ